MLGLGVAEPLPPSLRQCRAVSPQVGEGTTIGAETTATLWTHGSASIGAHLAGSSFRVWLRQAARIVACRTIIADVSVEGGAPCGGALGVAAPDPVGAVPHELRVGPGPIGGVTDVLGPVLEEAPLAPPAADDVRPPPPLPCHQNVLSARPIARRPSLAGPVPAAMGGAALSPAPGLGRRLAMPAQRQHVGRRWLHFTPQKVVQPQHLSPDLDVARVQRDGGARCIQGPGLFQGCINHRCGCRTLIFFG